MQTEQAGWQPVAARRVDAAERRFLASGATVAVVDGRGAFEEGLAAVRLLAEAVEANASALLVLVSRGDADRLAAMHSAGATHYLASPFHAEELAVTLRFAARHAERLGGGKRAAYLRSALLAAEEHSWSWLPGDSWIGISPSLAHRLKLEGGNAALHARAMLAKLDAEGRRSALNAIRRVRIEGGATAFAHASGEDDNRRIAHHLVADPGDGRITGRIEDLDTERTIESRDGLTGLTDNRGMRRWLNNQLKRQEACVLILLSVSRFEMVNAAFGHGTGDVMLRAIARRIERLLLDFPTHRHVVARLAGAEYAVALSGLLSQDETRLLTEQIAEAITRPFASGETMVRLSCRMGFSASETGETESAPLIRRASTALAEAKTGDGSGVIRSLDASGEEASARRSMLEVDLRRALDQDEIEILFQPQIAVTSRKMIGVEALARWHHPQFGDLGAAPLFAAAERSDYIVPLSAHIQRKALETVAAHGAIFENIRVAINVTASDIAMPHFVSEFLAMIERSRVQRSQVTVEITETGLIEDLGRAATLLANLRAAGLRVAIDDFGTGYSSLAYLKALPLDYLKIDQKLAQDIAGSTRDRVVVKGVIDMARSLGLTVVAEGVETEKQLSLLAEAGANVVQGYLFSEPVPIEKLRSLELDR